MGALISNYKQKRWVVEAYEKDLSKEEPAKRRLRLFQFWYNQVIPSLTQLAIGLYIAIGSTRVLSGETTIGTFIATVNVYRDFGDRFEDMYHSLRTSLQALEPLVGLAQMLNFETDIEDRMKVNRDNRTYNKESLQEMMEDKCAHSFDRIPIRLNNIVTPPHHHSINADIRQGSLV